MVNETITQNQNEPIDFFSYAFDSNNLKMYNVKSELAYGKITIDDAHDKFNEWKNTSSYIILSTVDDSNIDLTPNYDFTNPYVQEIYNKRKKSQPIQKLFAVKLMKRGNDVYVNKVKKRLQSLIDLCYTNKDLTLLNPKSNHGRSNILRIDLTYDTKRCSSEQSAKNIGKEYNLFLTNLKERYGKISEFRVFEFTKKGMAHVHGVYIFHDYDFTVTKQRSSKNGLNYFRVSDYQRKKLQKMYHSYINVYALYNSKQLNYCLKYLSKEFFDAEGSITPFLLTLYDNRAYGLSKGFDTSLNDVFVGRGGIPINRLDYTMYNSKNNDIEYNYVGNFSSKIDFGKWFFEIKPPPIIDWSKKGDEIEIPNYFDEGGHIYHL